MSDKKNLPDIKGLIQSASSITAKQISGWKRRFAVLERDTTALLEEMSERPPERGSELARQYFGRYSALLIEFFEIDDEVDTAMRNTADVTVCSREGLLEPAVRTLLFDRFFEQSYSLKTRPTPTEQARRRQAGPDTTGLAPQLRQRILDAASRPRESEE